MKIEDVTIVIPTSVSPIHPSTEIIDAVISGVRKYFPNNEIILQIDGLREEQSHRKDQYDEYKSRVLWKCLHEWKNVLPIVFESHEHQSNMMSKTIDLIKTPLMLYNEGDIALQDDLDVDWQEVVNMFNNDKAYTVRFYSYHYKIEEAHKHLMLEQKGNYVRSFQWSQQPHISRVDYYRNVVLPNTTPNLFIEDKFYGKIFADCHETLERWSEHRLWLYNPPGKDIRIVNNLDGRKGLRKFTSDDEAWGLTEA